jgi:ribonuclease Z
MSDQPDHLHRPSIPVPLSLGDLEVEGFSIGGLATYFLVPEWRVCFDIGDCPIEAVRMNHVFLTHAHGDHARCLLRHFSLRRMLNMERASYHVPEFLVEPLKKLAYAWSDLEGHRRNPDYLPDLQGMGARDEVELNRQIVMTSFPVDHRVRSLGYTTWEKRKKLLPELVGMPGPEIAARKYAGLPIESETRTPRLTFIGDSTMRTLEREMHVLQSRVLVLETTFIMDDDVDMADPKGHIHLATLCNFLAANRDLCNFEFLVLKHFSMKYPRRLIEARVRALVPDFLKDRVKVLI